MSEKYEEAIDILMENIGWVWCDDCQNWQNESSEGVHKRLVHGEYI